MSIDRELKFKDQMESDLLLRAQAEKKQPEPPAKAEFSGNILDLVDEAEDRVKAATTQAKVDREALKRGERMVRNQSSANWLPRNRQTRMLEEQLKSKADKEAELTELQRQRLKDCMELF